MFYVESGVNTGAVDFPSAASGDSLQGWFWQRFGHLIRLARLRYDGVRHPQPLDMLVLTANLYRFLDLPATPATVKRFLCPQDADEVTDDMADHAIRIAPHWPIGNEQAGKLANLTLEELETLQAEEAVTLTMCPVDETTTERVARRQARADKTNAERQRRYRAKRKSNVVAPVTVLINNSTGGRYAEPATLQRGRILAAISNGAHAPADIVQATGLPRSTVAPWLTKLKTEGAITSPRRGVYELAGNPDQVPGAAAPTEQQEDVASTVAPIGEHQALGAPELADDVGNPDTMPADPVFCATVAQIMPANVLPALYLLALPGAAEIVVPRRHRRASAARRCLSRAPRTTRAGAVCRRSRAYCTGPPIRFLVHSVNDHWRGARA